MIMSYSRAGAEGILKSTKATKLLGVGYTAGRRRTTKIIKVRMVKVK